MLKKKKVFRRKSFNNASVIYILYTTFVMCTVSTPLKTLCVGNYVKSPSAHHISRMCTYSCSTLQCYICTYTCTVFTTAMMCVENFISDELWRKAYLYSLLRQTTANAFKIIFICKNILPSSRFFRQLQSASVNFIVCAHKSNTVDCYYDRFITAGTLVCVLYFFSVSINHENSKS